MAAPTSSAPASPPLLLDPAKAAYLFIDLQPIFTDLVPNPSFQANIEDMLHSVRALSPRVNASAIIHIRANYVNSKSKPFTSVIHPERPVPSDTAGVSWASEEEGEKVVVKSTIDGFQETELEQYLRSMGIEYIVCAGLLTAACVHETAIGGQRGFHAYFVS
jgi:nicotinamidase-related amidase